MENNKMQSYMKFSPRDYIMGRIPLPPFVLSKKQRPFVYGDQVTIANNTAGRIDLAIDADAHFLVEGIHIISSLRSASQDLAAVQITDTTNSTPWSNVAVPLRDIAGKGDAPKYISDPNLLRPSSTLAIQISNVTGSTATFYVAFIGRKVYDLSHEEVALLTRRMFYQYIMPVGALTAGQVDVLGTIQIYNESDFLVKRLLSSELMTDIQAATAGSESAEVLMNVRDTSFDQTLFNKKLAARLLFGQLQGSLMTTTDSGSHTTVLQANGSAYTLKKPWLIRRTGIIEGRFDNKANSTLTGGFRLVFEGVRMFDAAR